MNRPVLIGLDLGTTHLKAAACTPRGEMLAVSRVPTPAVPRGAGAEYDPEAMWEGVVAALREVCAELPGPVAGVGIASMGESGVLLDGAGRPLYPFVAWFDPRTEPQVAWLTSRVPAAAWFSRTGLHIGAKHGLCKLVWLKDAHPDAFRRGAVWLNVADYIAFRLTGRAATCPSLASRTLAYDLDTEAWAPDLLAAAEVPASLFPPIVPEGATVGPITPAAAAATGLVAGTPVALGGHDHPCAAVAAGVIEPGHLLDSTGTAEAIIGAVDRPERGNDALASRISVGPLPLPGLYGFQAGIQASGGSVEWFRREVLGGAAYAALAEEAAGAGPLPSGVLYVPHLAGAGPPDVEPASKGAFVGLTYAARRAHLIKAVLEGTAFELRRMVSAMEALVGISFHRIVVTGGHVHNPLWLQLKADILGRPVSVPDVAEATLLGAALLGGVAGGIFSDAREAARAVAGRERIIAPREEPAAAYRRYAALYDRLVPAILALYREWPDRASGGD